MWQILSSSLTSDLSQPQSMTVSMIIIFKMCIQQIKFFVAIGFLLNNNAVSLKESVVPTKLVFEILF